MGLAVKEAEGNVSIYEEEQLVVRYRAVTEASKPHIDVLNLPPGAGDIAGKNMVLSAPHDHPWHFGLFFCQKLIDGINGWATERNAATGRPYAFFRHRDYEVEDSDAAVTINQNGEWVSNDGERLLNDAREIRVFPSDEDAYFLTWAQEVEASRQSRHLSSESVHGHYSGLSARFRRSQEPGQYRMASHADDAAANGDTAKWCDYSIPLDGNIGSVETLEAGVTMMDHPENPSHPTHWFISTDGFGFVSANPTWKTVLRIDEGESISWKWGIWIHGGTPTREEINDAYTRYRTLVE